MAEADVHSAIKLVKMRLRARFSFLPTNLPTIKISMLVGRLSALANVSCELHVGLVRV